jgi:hypothetical protein
MGAIEDEILAEVSRIPPEKRPEVLKVVRELRKKYNPEFKFKDMLGMFADQGIDITADEIDEMRRELWGIAPAPEQPKRRKKVVR